MDNQLKKQIEINDRNIFSPEQKKYSVYLPKYGITVQTALTDAREIMFSTEISALKQSRDMYFALGRLGESKKDFTNGFFKQAAKGLGASAVNIAGNLYGAAVNLGWKGVNAAAFQWTRANKAAEVSTPEELAFATKVDKAKYEEAERAREAWTKRQRADLQDFMQKAGLDKTQFDGFVYDLISGGGTALAALAVGAITKSPGAVAAMFGAVSGQDYYGEALEAGLTGDKALAVGFGAGALEGALERYGTQQLFKAMASTKAFKTPIRAIMRYARQKGVYGVAEAAARGALTESAEEFTQNIASSAVMNTAGVRDDSYDEIIAESFYGAMLGALVGGGMAGAGRAAALAASKLEKAGMPKDIAKDVAGKIIEQAYEKESIEEAIKLAESENSPLTYENSDKAAAARKFGEQVRDFADPEKRARASREAWNIKDAVEKEALKAGLSPEQAATAAQAYQSAVNMFYANTGVMPKDWWEQYRLEIQNDMQNRAGGKGSDTFYQAAMYKNPRTDIKEFVDFVLSGQERKKSYFSFETKSGELWRVPGDTVIHDKKRHPDITKKDWEVLLDNFNKSKFYYPKNPQPVFAGNPYYGVFEHNGQNYGFIFEVLDSGERQVSSLFKNTKNGIEAFIKEKAANALEPLLQSSQLAFNKESGADFVGRPKDSITKEGQKDNRFNQAPAEGARGYVEFTGQGVFMRLLEEADPSTVVHEVCGHVLLRNVEDIKSFAEVNGGAREEFNGIWEDLEKWLGPAERVEENGKVKYRFNRAQQEMFAEGMEKMFAAGKAPTGTLEKIFKYFRDMLSAMYAEAREWLNLRPEVEELFGKILSGTQIEEADSKIYKGRAADVKAVSARARKGEAASINGLGIKEVKALIKQLGKRRPAMPKEDLLTVLKRKGADYANAAKIDAEAYANAGVKDKAGGIKDDAALWLKEEGFAVDISEEQAWALIEKALDGEKVYRPEDMERIAAIENFDANIEAIREAFGGNIREAEETLRAIEDLEAKGYRVIGNSDVEYAEEQTGKLLSYFERERELKKQIANLTEDKEELGNIAERRLKEISRRAALAREEGYKEAIKDAQDKKTVKDLLAVEREAEKNALDARRVKNALIEELGKRELLGKEEMLKALKEAQGTEEITSAAVKLISALHKSFGETQEGQAEKRKTDLPGTNWAEVKVKALGNFGKTLKEAGADVKRAQTLEKQASAARLKGIKLDDKAQAQVDNARSKVLKGYALKYARALKEAFAGVPHIDGVWLDKAANAIGREYAGRENIIGRPLDQLIERAKKRQAENYKRYLGEKIEKIISAGYKVKDGQKQKGKYDYVTNKLFEDLAHIKNMDKTAAKAELERRLKIINNAPSNAEAALKIFELDGEAENISPDFVENMKFENAWLAFKAGKMSDKEMAMAKESLAEQGLPDDIGEDRWHNVTPEFLSRFYEDLTQRRQAALEGRLSQSAELAFKVREEREAYAKAVRENGKAGLPLKGYIKHVANWESIHNAFANKEISEKYSLLEAEAQAEVKTSEKMKEIVRQVSETLGAKDAKAVKKWFDGLDEEAGVWQNRMESKRMALQEAAPAVRQQMEAVDEFRKLLSGKEEIILKDFLSFTDAHGEKKNHNLKIAFDGKDGGLKSIFEEQGYEGVMKAVHAALKGLIVKNDGNTVFIRVRNDFAAVLKYSNPGGKGTYTLIDYALFDEKGRQTAGYGVRVKQVNAGVLNPVEFKKGIEELIRADKTRVKKIDIGPVSSQLVQAAKAHNIDIYGYRHNIDNSAINHTLKRHGNKKMEESRGQIAVTAEDFLKIPEILNNPDYIAFGAKNKKGLDLIVYGKNMPDGSSIYIEEIRSETLTANSMRKYKGSLDSSSFAKRIGNAHNTQTSNISIVEKNGNVKGGELKQKEASEAFPSPKEGATEATDSLTEKEADVNSKETAFEVKKAALNAAQNALNPYMDGIYKPVAQKLTKGQIIDIYNMAKNPVGYARLENQYGYDQLTEMFSLLSKEDKQIADHWQKTVEEGHGEINKVFIKQYGLDMGRPAHYWPFSVERITSEVDMLGQNYAEAHRPGLTKTRTSGQLVEMKPMNPVEKLYKHYGRAMQYVHTAEKVSWLRRVLRDSKIKKTIEEHFGEDAAKTLYELLDNSTIGVGKNSVKHYEDGVMNWLTNNYVKAAIAAKPSIALKQLISVVNYAENMPAGQWAEGFVKALGDFKNTIDFMMQDPYLKTRWENGTQNEALMRALAQDFGKTKGVKALNSFTNILAINVRLGDIGAIIFGGKPYIDYLMQSKGMSKEEAFRQFRLDTLRSQQASQRSSLSRLQAKEMNWLMRALFAFKNTNNQYVRKIADAIIMYKRGEIDAKQLAKTVAIYAVINQYLYVAATSLGMLGAAYAGFDDEDKNREMLAEFMIWPAQNFGFLPILDDAVNQASYRLTNLALGGKSGALRNPEVPLIKDVYDAVRSLGKDDLTFEDWVNAAAPLAQTATGLPVKYFAGAAKTPYELAKGNFTKTALILGGWSEKRAEKTTAAE